MKTKIRLALLALLTAAGAFGAEARPPAQREADALAKAKAEYPLKTCVITDEPLAADAVDYVHQETGKPDRLVRFCCEGCVDDFKKEPAKFLKKLDDAAKAQPAKKKS